MLFIIIIFTDRRTRFNNIIVPLTQAVYEGDRAFITCHSKTPPIFTRRGMEIRSYNNSVSGNILILNKVKEGDSGNYTCHGSIINQTFEVYSELLVGGNVDI